MKEKTAEEVEQEIAIALEHLPDYQLVNARAYAMDKADEWFDEAIKLVPRKFVWNKEKDGNDVWYDVLTEEWNDKFWDKVDEIEEELLHYSHDSERNPSKENKRKETYGTGRNSNK